jgi:outer membrane lipase/esterase
VSRSTLLGGPRDAKEVTCNAGRLNNKSAWGEIMWHRRLAGIVILLFVGIPIAKAQLSNSFSQFKYDVRPPVVPGPQAHVAVNTPVLQMNNIRQELDLLRLQGSPTVAAGLRIGYGGQALPPTSAFALAPVGQDGKLQTGGGASADTPNPFERWGVFVNGDVDVGRQSTTNTQTGFKVTYKSIMLGTDYRFVGNHVLGASLGFSKADTDLDAGAGTQDAKGYSFSLYGSYVPQENAYIDGILTVGHNKYNSQRLQTDGTFATSNNHGDHLGLSVSAGYAFNRGPLAVTPYGRVEYIDAKVDGLTESGNSAEALTLSDQRIKATTLSIGGQASYALSTSWGVLVPNGRLELQHVAQNNVKNVSVRLASDITSAGDVPTLGPDRTFGRYALGVSTVLPRGVGAFFNYEQLFGKDNFSDRHYTLGLRVGF